MPHFNSGCKDILVGVLGATPPLCCGFNPDLFVSFLTHSKSDRGLIQGHSGGSPALYINPIWSGAFRKRDRQRSLGTRPFWWELWVLHQCLGFSTDLFLHVPDSQKERETKALVQRRFGGRRHGVVHPLSFSSVLFLVWNIQKERQR